MHLESTTLNRMLQKSGLIPKLLNYLGDTACSGYNLFFILIKQPPLGDYVSSNCQLQHILRPIFPLRVAGWALC